jgi:SNF2 family DNA or RNA helicase
MIPLLQQKWYLTVSCLCACIGQRRNVQVHKFLCAGTLEEKIDEIIERKQELAASIVGTGEGWLTELSNDHLKELFALRREAVGE